MFLRRIGSGATRRQLATTDGAAVLLEAHAIAAATSRARHVAEGTGPTRVLLATGDPLDLDCSLEELVAELIASGRDVYAPSPRPVPVPVPDPEPHPRSGQPDSAHDPREPIVLQPEAIVPRSVPALSEVLQRGPVLPDPDSGPPDAA